jgi:hypothetical protein
VVTAAIVLNLAQSEPPVVPDVAVDRTPTISQSEPAQPERLPLSPEEKHLGDWQEIQREQREREAFDLGYAVRPPEQVEERHRPDTRPER